MPRSLPLGSPGQEPGLEPDPEATSLFGLVEVFDPAMCCSTGVCGPAVDPSLLAIARDLRWLERRGATVHRAGLAQLPEVFTSTPRVAGLMQAFGDGALPAVLVNGEVLSYGRYATREEIRSALAGGAPESTSPPEACGPGCDCG